MEKQTESVWSKVLGRLRRYIPALLGSLILALVHVAMSLYIPILVGRAIDVMIGKGRVDFPTVFRALKGILICACVGAGAQWLMNELNNRVTYRVAADIRKEAFDRLQILPLSYLDGHRQGDLVSRVISDVDTFSDGLLMGASQFFTGIMTIFGTIFLLLRFSWQIALVVIFVTPLSLLVARFIAKRTYDMFRLQTATRGEQTALIDEYIGQAKVVKAFGHEKEAMERFDEGNARLADSSLKAVFFSSLTNPSTRFVNSVVYAGVALIGALVAIGNGITVGSLTTFLNYANQYTKPFNEISGVVTELQNALACAGRVFELIEAAPQTPDPEDPQLPATVTGAMEIQNVAFSYDPARPLIRNFTLSVKAGQRVAIVGPTGCGKTTFINLLMRFYDPQEGQILLDGVPIRNMRREDLRGSIGMVLQDTWLRSGTVRENLAMGKPDASLEEIVAAAKKAHADSFIRRLPQGYDTVLSESGGSLSQGQKQLLCIARVMLCLPPMLILDEATSSIDTRTEHRIQKAFNTMMQGRTSFIVAHRLSTIREADVILVMKDGQIIEQGTHDSLLAAGGFYAELYESQFAKAESE